MSTAYTFVCPAHDEFADGDGTNSLGLASLRSLWHEREALAAFCRSPLDMAVLSGPTFFGCFGDGNLVEFVVEHAACPVRIRDEYGRDHGPPDFELLDTPEAR